MALETRFVRIQIVRHNSNAFDASKEAFVFRLVQGRKPQCKAVLVFIDVTEGVVVMCPECYASKVKEVL